MTGKGATQQPLHEESVLPDQAPSRYGDLEITVFVPSNSGWDIGADRYMRLDVTVAPESLAMSSAVTVTGLLTAPTRGN
ncbi:hypothetical protein Kisp02_55070 [Kineosporia sp. NBRC 101731]|nr:hypothetical protein Kisp02_55070 [Kineosporia sp. NBRC 101731]